MRKYDKREDTFTLTFTPTRTHTVGWHLVERYLRVDTSIDCSSSDFRTFRVVNGLFIFVYLSIPLLWAVLLYLARDRLNPRTSDRRLAYFLRDNDLSLAPIRFLFSVYKPNVYYFESFEMFRRIVFIGLLPLFSPRSDRRAAVGMALAQCSAIFYRESGPFRRKSTNTLVYIAQCEERGATATKHMNT
jgi:hypothetical protein